MRDSRVDKVFYLSLLWIGYCGSYLIRKPLGVIKTVLGGELDLSTTQLGFLDMAFVLPYALIQIGFPGISKQFGAKTVFIVCLFMGGIVSFTSSLARNFVQLLASLLATGSFLAPTWPACSHLLSNLFDGSSNMNFYFGVLSSATFVGGLGGTALSALMLHYSGWRSVFWPPSLITCIISLLLLLVRIPEKSEVADDDMSDTAAARAPRSARKKQSLLALSRIPGVRELATIMFCQKFVRYVMYMWLPLYLVEYLGLSKLQAGIYSTVFDVGGTGGSILAGIIMDKLFSRNSMKGIAVFQLIGTLSFGALLLSSGWGIALNGMILFLAGATNCGLDGLLSGSCSMEVGERNDRKSGAGVTSLVNGVGNVGGMIEGPLVGLVLRQYGWQGVMLLVFSFTIFGLIACIKSYKDVEKLNNTSSAV